MKGMGIMYELLIVDDEPLITDSLCTLLKRNEYIRNNCEIHKAYNAYEAQFLVGNECIDLIISDVNMPDMDGITFRNKLISEKIECAFVFISGYSDFDNIYRAMKIPNTIFLLKSELDEEIIKVVLEQLKLISKNKKEEKATGEISDVKIIREIDEFLYTHLKNEGCLIAVADYVSMSPAYLSRLYKQLTGVNFSKRVCQIKIERSQYYLKETKMKVYEISQEVGFISSSAFVYFFKKNTGMTPQQYRNQSGLPLQK